MAAAALPEDARLRPIVLARLSVALSFVGSAERRLDLANAAVAGARRGGDGRPLAAAIAARCDAIAGPDHNAERLGAASEVIALAQRAGDLPLDLLGRRLRVVALFELRDMAALEAEMAAFARSAAALGDPLYTWYVPMWQAMHAYADGRVDEALRLAAAAGELGRSAGSTNAEMLRITLGLFVGRRWGCRRRGSSTGFGRRSAASCRRRLGTASRWRPHATIRFPALVRGFTCR